MFSLNEDQVARFHRDGFLVIRAAEHGVFPPAQVYDWAYEVKSWPKENGKWMPYDEINIQGDRQLLRTENFADYHAGFDGLLRKALCRPCCSDYLARKCFSSKTRSITRHPMAMALRHILTLLPITTSARWST